MDKKFGMGSNYQSDGFPSVTFKSDLVSIFAFI